MPQSAEPSRPQAPLETLLPPPALAAANVLPGDAGDGIDDGSAELLDRYGRGDQEAFDALVHRHQLAAYGLARHILGEGELAYDVVQEAFLRVLRNHQRYQRDKPFRTWFLHIVRNLAIDAIRRRRPHGGGALLDRVPARDHPIGLEQQELQDRVLLVLQDLPEKYRMIIVMREMEGMAAEDIARIIETDYGTTRWRLHKARCLFRAAWISRFGEET